MNTKEDTKGSILYLFFGVILMGLTMYFTATTSLAKSPKTKSPTAQNVSTYNVDAAKR